MKTVLSSAISIMTRTSCFTQAFSASTISRTTSSRQLPSIMQLKSSTWIVKVARGNWFTRRPMELHRRSQSSQVAKALPAAIPRVGHTTAVTHFLKHSRRLQL